MSATTARSTPAARPSRVRRVVRREQQRPGQLLGEAVARCGGELRVGVQRRTAVQVPLQVQAARPDRREARVGPAHHAGERDDLARAQREQLRVPRQHRRMLGFAALVPAQPRGREGLRRGRIGRRPVLAMPPVAHRLRQLRLEIAEEEERSRRRPLLTHEEQRRRRREQEQRAERAQRRGRSEPREPFAERTVPDLIVVLQEGDERGQREVRARRAARLAAAMRRALALIREPRRQRPAERAPPDRAHSRRSSRCARRSRARARSGARRRSTARRSRRRAARRRWRRSPPPARRGALRSTVCATAARRSWRNDVRLRIKMS